MINGEIKHSSELVEEDLINDIEQHALLKKHGISVGAVPTLHYFQSDPGFYILYAPGKRNVGGLKGPFETQWEAAAAHKEWMYEYRNLL